MSRICHIFSCSICLLLAFLIITPASQAAEISIYLNDVQLKPNVPPIVENSRVLVPLRVISEKIGATVNYIPQGKKIEIKKDNTLIKLAVDSKKATVNGKNNDLDVPARAIKGNTLVPLRFVGEALSLDVNWMNASKKVFLKSKATYPEMDLSKMEADLLTSCNNARKNGGLSPLIKLPLLSKMADNHVQDMVKNNFFSHNSPANGDVAKRAAALGLNNIGENLAYNYPDAQGIYQAWMASAQHKKNILANKNGFVGFGFYQKSGSYNKDIYCVGEFMAGEGFFTVDRNQKLTGKTLDIKGFAVNNGAEIIIYRLDPNDSKKYLSKSSQKVDIKDDYSFAVKVELPEQGNYLLALGEDRLSVQY
ncbi:MAG: stalk domain-containing protein [Clostridiales bacterium]